MPIRNSYAYDQAGRNRDRARTAQQVRQDHRTLNQIERRAFGDQRYVYVVMKANAISVVTSGFGQATAYAQVVGGTVHKQRLFYGTELFDDE